MNTWRAQAVSVVARTRRKCGILVTSIQQIRSDKDLRARTFWYVILLFPAMVFIPIGGGYAFSGHNAYTDAPFRVFIDVFPHSLRAHGWILLVIGIWILAAEMTMLSGNTTKGFRHARSGVILGGAYSTWSFVSLLGATWLNHKYTPAMFWYLGTLIVCGALAMLAPPFNRARVPDAA